jgi:hypothetical protein
MLRDPAASASPVGHYDGRFRGGAGAEVFSDKSPGPKCVLSASGTVRRPVWPSVFTFLRTLVFLDLSKVPRSPIEDAFAGALLE